jgi:hypothetical protein
MSQLRISRPGLPTEVIALGPAYARRQGYGGSALGHFTGTTLQVGPSMADRSATQQRADER